MSELLFPENTYFPQCHASCLLQQFDGRMLCAYFAGTHEKHQDVGIWMSEYDGSKWLAPRLLIKLCDEPHWNPVLFHTRLGIRLVFKVGCEISSWRSYTMHSIDGGRSWTGLHSYHGSAALGPVRSKPLRLSSGELLAPNSEEANGWLPYVDLSTDEGDTFHRLSSIPINTSHCENDNFLSGRGAIQPVLWESEPGSIHALLRTSAGRIFRSDSGDYGRSWCIAYPTEMPNNNSAIDAVCASDGRIFLACNPVSGDFVERTPLCIYESRDNGNRFDLFYTVNNEKLDPLTGRAAEFSYPSLNIQNNQLFLSYTWNRRSVAFDCIPISL